MWTPSTDAEYEKRLDKWPNKHHRELQAMLDNADTLIETLDCGASIEQCKTLGFVHSKYPLGVLSIDQKGGGAGLKQCRLYVFPDKEVRELCLLTMGDKSSQNADVNYATKWVKTLLSAREARKTDDKAQEHCEDAGGIKH